MQKKLYLNSTSILVNKRRPYDVSIASETINQLGTPLLHEYPGKMPKRLLGNNVLRSLTQKYYCKSFLNKNHVQIRITCWSFSTSSQYVLCAEDLDYIKTKTKEIALSSFHTYNNNVPETETFWNFWIFQDHRTSSDTFRSQSHL